MRRGAILFLLAALFAFALPTPTHESGGPSACPAHLDIADLGSACVALSPGFQLRMHPLSVIPLAAGAFGGTGARPGSQDASIALALLAGKLIAAFGLAFLLSKIGSPRPARGPDPGRLAKEERKRPEKE